MYCVKIVNMLMHFHLKWDEILANISQNSCFNIFNNDNTCVLCGETSFEVPFNCGWKWILITFVLVTIRIYSKLIITFDSKWEVYFVLFLQLQVSFVDDAVNPKVNRG